MTCPTCKGERELFEDRGHPGNEHYTIHRPCPDCTPGAPRAGVELAMSLFGAKLSVRRAELALEHLLDAIYGTRQWLDFETERSDRSIDVFGVEATDAASDDLLAAGFSAVRQHAHDKAHFIHCGCATVRHLRSS